MKRFHALFRIAKKCDNCGSLYDTDTIFCGNCGKTVIPEPELLTLVHKGRRRSWYTVLLIVMALLALSGWGSYIYAKVAPPTSKLISTQTPLSDGRLQAWKAFTHKNQIESRYVDHDEKWTPWSISDYPPSGAGVTGLFAYTQSGITYLIVLLDDETCWQYHKLSISADANFSSFSHC